MPICPCILTFFYPDTDAVVTSQSPLRMWVGLAKLPRRAAEGAEFFEFF